MTVCASAANYSRVAVTTVGIGGAGEAKTVPQEQQSAHQTQSLDVWLYTMQALVELGKAEQHRMHMQQLTGVWLYKM